MTLNALPALPTEVTDMLDRDYLLSYLYPTVMRIAHSRRVPERVAVIMATPFRSLMREQDRMGLL